MNLQIKDPRPITNGHIRIGVVGYCPPTKFDEIEARRLIVEAYSEVAKHYTGDSLTIVSGLTNVGILAIAYEEAVKRNWTTVGIACAKVAGHALFPVDEKVIVGESWGDESATFTSMLDGMIRVGGNKQSLRETNEVKAQGLPVWEYNLPVLD